MSMVVGGRRKMAVTNIHRATGSTLHPGLRHRIKSSIKIPSAVKRIPATLTQRITFSVPPENAP
jgi:hypothetical protein